MPLLTFRAQDAAGNTTPITLTATVPDPGGPAWLTNWADIHAAVYNPAVQTVYIGDGVYDIPHGQGLYVAQNGKRIIGQSMQGTVLRATGTRGQMKPLAGGLSHDATKGVIEVAAHGVEIGNLTLTQTLSQVTHNASDPTTYIVAGIWAAGNDWYLHDLIVDKCSFGMQLWTGAAPTANVLKRVHRCVITNWGYRGTEYGNSGYAIYEQCLSGVVENRDVVCMTGTDFGYHNYGSMTLPAQMNLTGIVVVDSGSPIPTGASGADTQLYMAKSERLRVENVHTGVYHPGTNLANTLFALSKVGYGSGFNPKKFEAVNTWHSHNPNLPAHPSNAWQNQAVSPWPEGFTQTGIKKHWLVADRPSFAGLKPLGGSWFVNYAATVPAGHEVVPGTKQFTAPAHGQPPLMIVRPTG